jgi:hypothetical protein
MKVVYHIPQLKFLLEAVEHIPTKGLAAGYYKWT